MSCPATPCSAMLCYVVLCFVVFCFACFAMLCCALLRPTVCYEMLCNAAIGVAMVMLVCACWYNAVPCFALLPFHYAVRLPTPYCPLCRLPPIPILIPIPFPISSLYRPARLHPIIVSSRPVPVPLWSRCHFPSDLQYSSMLDKTVCTGPVRQNLSQWIYMGTFTMYRL